MDVKQIDAGELNVGYVDAGPHDGPAVLLLHGWPYDIHAYDDVTPMLVAQGCRVIVPYLRGYGTTRFLSAATPRNGEQVALAVDAIALMDALGIERATLAGFDWGSRAAAIMAALWPRALRGAGGRERLPDRQRRDQPAAATAEGRARLVVPVLLRDRTRPARLPAAHARLQQADLADRLADVGLRRRHLRPHRGVVRQPGPRRHRDPQLPLAVGPRRRASSGTSDSSRGWPNAPRSRCRRSRSPATSTPRTRTARPMPTGSPAPTSTGSSTASGTTCPRRPRRPSPMPCSSSHITTPTDQGVDDDRTTERRSDPRCLRRRVELERRHRGPAGQGLCRHGPAVPADLAGRRRRAPAPGAGLAERAHRRRGALLRRPGHDRARRRHGERRRARLHRGLRARRGRVDHRAGRATHRPAPALANLVVDELGFGRLPEDDFVATSRPTSIPSRRGSRTPPSSRSR